MARYGECIRLVSLEGEIVKEVLARPGDLSELSRRTHALPNGMYVIEKADNGIKNVKPLKAKVLALETA